MPKPINQGWEVDPSTERIIKEGEQLAAKNVNNRSIKLIFNPLGGGKAPYLEIKLPDLGVSEEIKLDGKIPPSTGFFRALKEKQKNQKKRK